MIRDLEKAARFTNVGGAAVELGRVEGAAGHRPSGPRAALARQRAALARAALSQCRLCAHHCGVNRLSGELGICRAGATARVFSAQVESGDELELVPTFAVAFSGCDMRCEFCVTAMSSWNAAAGAAFDPEELGQRAEAALARGARTVMFLGGEPTVHLPAVLEFVAALPESARLVWKTNAHASAQALALLDGVFDVWLPDFKFGNDGCGRRVARLENYTRVVQQNLLWAARHSELIVRHVLLPGHVECCWALIAKWLAAELPRVKVSLQTAFWPRQKAGRNPELQRTIAPVEARRAFQLAREFDLNLVS